MTRQQVSCKFRVGPGRVPSFWHAENGSVTACHLYETGDGFVRIPLDLAPASSVFVVFKKDTRADHLVEIVSRPAMITSAIELLAMDSNKVKARVQTPGTYLFKTAQGRTGKIVVDQVPADQVITGPWKLNFPKERGAPATVTMKTLTDWTKSADLGVRYFSGTATYQKQFVLPEVSKQGGGGIMLDLGTVKEVATVRVNGKDVGVLWKQPYQIDIGRFVSPGKNQLEISVTNLWNNRIVGDLQSDTDKDITRTNLKVKFSAKSPLLSSGLIGPVTLRFASTITVSFKK
jgi:hypothetical protein